MSADVMPESINWPFKRSNFSGVNLFSILHRNSSQY